MLGQSKDQRASSLFRDVAIAPERRQHVIVTNVFGPCLVIFNGRAQATGKPDYHVPKGVRPIAS